MTTPVRIPVFFDFASTICFFTHRVMTRISSGLNADGIELVWSPIDLSVITGWARGEAFDDRRRTNIRRLSEELSIPVSAPSHWMDSRETLAAYSALNNDTDRLLFREAVWTWVYEEARSLDHPACLDQVRGATGLALPAPAAADFSRVERLSSEAMELGVVGVPTFLLDAYPLGIGIQDDPTMLSFLHRFAEKKRTSN